MMETETVTFEVTPAVPSGLESFGPPDGPTFQENLTPALRQLLWCAHGWWYKDQEREPNVRERPPTLSFSSALAALVGGQDDAC